MSAAKRDVQVKWIRLQWLDQKEVNTFKQDVSVGITEDRRTRTDYLNITVDGQPRLTEPLKQCRWLPDSAADGIAAVISSSAKIAIVYDSRNEQQREFFVHLKSVLENRREQDPVTPSLPPQPKIIVPQPIRAERQSIRTDPQPIRAEPQPAPKQWTVENLVESIERGSINDARQAAENLARSRTDVQLTLLSRGDERKAASADRSIPADAFRLNVEIECDINQAPIRTTIGVRSGTTLRMLKEQIAKQTKFAADDQFWFAFDRYPIRDEYVFGSGAPVVPIRLRPTAANRPQPPTDPIRSGDNVILYIARVTPL